MLLLPSARIIGETYISHGSPPLARFSRGCNSVYRPFSKSWVFVGANFKSFCLLCAGMNRS
jgi:hypothetical protein